MAVEASQLGSLPPEAQQFQASPLTEPFRPNAAVFNADTAQGAGNTLDQAIAENKLAIPTFKDLGGTMELPTPTGYTAESLTEAREQKVLKGHVIAVIGAGPEGIGGATALELALQGADVVTSSRLKQDNQGAKEQVEELRLLGSDALWIPGDVTDPEFGNKLIEEIVTNYGRIDGIVYAAGIRRDAPFASNRESRMRDAWEVNYWGFVRTTKALMDYLRGLSKGSTPEEELNKPRKITVISSVASQGSPGQAGAYADSKAAVNTLVKSLGPENAALSQDPRFAFLRGLSITAVSPAFVEGTPLIANVSPSDREIIKRWTGADRHLHPREVGQLATFVTSPFTEGVNGHVIVLVGKGPTPVFEEAV